MSFSNAPNTNLYSGTYGVAGTPDATHYTTTVLGGQNVFTMVLGSDGVQGNCATQRLNSTAGLLPYVLGSQPHYAEADIQLDSYTTDAFFAFWAMVQEHNAALSDTLAIPPAPLGSSNYEGFIEIDGVESSFGSFNQALHTVHDHHGTFSGVAAVASASQTVATPGVFTTAAQAYTAGLQVSITGTAPGGFALKTPYFVLAAGLTATTCQLAAYAGGPGIQCTASAACTIQPGYIDIATSNLDAGPVIDFTQRHRYGWNYDPGAKMVTFYVDDVQICHVNVAAYSYEIDPFHLYFILSCKSRGANTPYKMYVRNLQVWTP